MTLPPDILKDLEAFKVELREKRVLPTVVRKKRVRRPEMPAVHVEPKPVLPKDPTVRRNGKGSWLVMVPTGAAYRGLKTREDPVVRDAPITKALETKAANVAGTTARICIDAELFKRPRK